MSLRDDDATEPVTGGWAARYRLIRPSERRIAGVCGAIGRATGTDPLLWQVVMAVLIVFAGAGLALYVAGWLLFPSEGDEASAIESVFTSRKSSMSVVTTLLMTVGAVALGCIAAIATDGSPFLMFAGLIVAMVLLARRRAHTPPAPAAPEPPPRPVSGYQAPFAPGGPFARGDATVDYSAPLSPTRQLDAGSPPPPAEPARPQPRPRNRSALGVVVFSLIVIELSTAATIGMLGGAVSLGSALAVAVVLCGIGLLTGAWWGRARGLILLGGVLALALCAGTIFAVNGPAVPFSVDTTTVTDADAIPSRVSSICGSSYVDLSGVSFPDDETSRISLNAWNADVTIKLPKDVDLAVDLEQQRSRVTLDSRGFGSSHVTGTVSTGADGSGGGKLIVSGKVESGQLEVER
ncbi:MAG TPA: PspC domain-containing protein [Stackebrandtia sp.]|uniref:PspC domain-containing protein n=1 Tax=Stackebrandtia sp. TaxID=2023065 RepID=UPI002D567975|nr:PspC domain-containing protein [Stackebrandtia sp.]HZE37718.1 PspC domain-containing protein [Stackebrandtia sp.]